MYQDSAHGNTPRTLSECQTLLKPDRLSLVGSIRPTARVCENKKNLPLFY